MGLTRLLSTFAAGLALFPMAVCAQSQTDTEGHEIGNTGIILGGYAAASYSDLKGGPLQVSLDSLSAFFSWEAPAHWSFFSELELEDALIATPSNTRVDDAYLALERFHLDYAWSDALQLRAGKFLTPIGRWNQVHAAPLTWTTSRPLITEAVFPTNATGFMARGVVPVSGRALEWSLYSSIGHELFPEPDLDIFTEAVGIHLNQELPGNFQFGVSFADFEQRFEADAHKTLYGADLFWSYGRAEVMAEWVLRSKSSSNSTTEESGYYLQGVAPLAGSLFGVVRMESLDPKTSTDYHVYLGGLAWRFRPGYVLKGEYTHAAEPAPGGVEGFRASFSMLF